MKNHLIPLNNDLKKLVAFIPSLEKNWRDNQRIDSKPFQIESLSTIEKLRDEGWNIQNGMEIRGKNRKVTSHQIRMTHSDYKIKNKFGKDIEITSPQAVQIANNAMDLRFGPNNGIDSIQLLNIHRQEDKGNDLWTVYNRIQENITQPNMIVNQNGTLLSGINGYQDTILNKQLFKLIQDHVKQLN